MADKKVGTGTGKKTQAGRDVYKTPEGEMVSEKSTTFKYKGMWINIPSIHNGHKYDDATLKLMLEAEIIKPTSSHKSREDAEQAARKRSDNLKFNKGGTAMKDQMSFFEDGGLKDEGGMVDEVSGNEVPSGSTRKEVRDDISANISEGEFIFPADVVRYLGLEKLMQMRQMAKMGLKEMEAMGQMGNSDEATMPDDLPFGMADLIIVEGEDDSEENNFAVGGIQWPVSPADVPIETKVYINEAGNKINIRFQGDKPLDTIPDGYVLFTEQVPVVQDATPVVQSDNDSDDPAPKNPFVEAGSWSDAPLDMYITELKKITGPTSSVVTGVAAALGGPLIGAAMYLGTKLNKKQALATIDQRIEQAKKTTVPGQVKFLREAKAQLEGKTDTKTKGVIPTIIDAITGSLGLTNEQANAAKTTAVKVEDTITKPKPSSDGLTSLSSDEDSDAVTPEDKTEAITLEDKTEAADIFSQTEEVINNVNANLESIRGPDDIISNLVDSVTSEEEMPSTLANKRISTLQPPTPVATPVVAPEVRTTTSTLATDPVGFAGYAGRQQSYVSDQQKEINRMLAKAEEQLARSVREQQKGPLEIFGDAIGFNDTDLPIAGTDKDVRTAAQKRDDLPPSITSTSSTTPTTATTTAPTTVRASSDRDDRSSFAETMAANKSAGAKARKSFDKYVSDPTNSKAIADNAAAVSRTKQSIENLERGIKTGFKRGGLAARK